MRLLSCPGSSNRCSKRKEDQIVSSEKIDDLLKVATEKTPRKSSVSNARNLDTSKQTVPD